MLIVYDITTLITTTNIGLLIMRMLLILSLVFLSSCQQIWAANAALYKSQCLSYGFLEGSPELAQCMMTVDQSYRSNSVGLMNATTQYQNMLQQNQPQSLRMNCVSMPYKNGGGNTTCF